MVNWNFYCCRVIIFFYIILLSIDKSSTQFVTVNCYECTNCTDPFDKSSNSLTITSSCNTCYKLAVTIAYAPYIYVIRKCVPACLETSQTFAGGSVMSTCCATDLCNASSRMRFSRLSRFFLLIFLILKMLKDFFY